MSEQKPEDLYPSVDLAYEIATDSYDAVIKRIDFIDGRIQTLLAFIVTTTAIAPSVANTRGVPFRSIWFYLALGTVAVALILGSYARHMGRIQMLDPAVFFEKWLHYTPWEFKKNLIYWAGQDFATNTNLVQKKWRLSVTITFLFFLEAVFLVVWVSAAVAKT